MDKWKKTGFIATLVIVLAFPLYLVRVAVSGPEKGVENKGALHYTGTESCVECHKQEYDDWLISHHAHAMDTASEQSVRGDFNNSEFSRYGVTSRFYKKDGKYYVHTQGPEGKMGDFQVAYTFGYTPLQQYLIPFEGGRLQCLPIAWDTEKERWYHLADSVYHGEDIKPDDWLYWTNNGQNWNGMCADCHSTDLKKGFDPESRTFHTTWFEINVGCEACHGQGSAHLDWANLPEMARPEGVNYGLVVKTSGITNKEYVDECARCHSRRSVYGDFNGSFHHLLDYINPQNPSEPYYYPDGQILDEDYVYASFLQSKMYDNDIQCNDCHNVHSGKTIYPVDGNELCIRCHRAEDYDTYNHHFHKYKGEEGKDLILGDSVVKVGEGALCINCHMPGKYYMGVDFRRDHSIRIPRPDLTLEIGSPNACNQCHTDKSAKWSLKYVNQWYGENKRSHYGLVFSKGAEGDSTVIPALAKLAMDTLYPVNIRTTAINQLGYFPDAKAQKSINENLNDPEAVVRYTSVQVLQDPSPEVLASTLTPFLKDPVKAVRMVTAFRLSSIPGQYLRKDTLFTRAYQRALDEYIRAMYYASDFAASRHNLGIVYANLGDQKKSAENYREAIRIDNQFYPSKLNLSMVYNRLGENAKAELLLRDVVKNHPEVNEAYYSLGLLLAEEKKYKESAVYLEKAVEIITDRPRIYYNLSLLYQYLQEPVKAEKAMLKALDIEPGNPDFIFAMADFYLKRGEADKAEVYALKLKKMSPGNQNVQNLLDAINRLKQKK